MDKDLNDISILPNLFQVGETSSSLCVNLLKHGAYIHVIRANVSCEKRLREIQCMRSPTSACAVGVGPFKLIDKDQWNGCSGLVFSPKTWVVLGSHVDMNARDLNNQNIRNWKFFCKNPERPKKNELINYGEYLRDTICQTKGDCGLVPVVGAVRLRMKLREIEMRRVNDYRSDVSSKYQMMLYIGRLQREEKRNYLPPYSNGRFLWETNDEACLNSIEELIKIRAYQLRNNPNNRMDGYPHHLINVIDKINYLRGRDGTVLSRRESPRDSKLYQYLDKAFYPIRPRGNESDYLDEVNGFYKNYKKEGYRNLKELIHNEALILPSIKDICGIYVNVSSVRGVDKAFEIRRAFQKVNNGKSVPAFCYLQNAEPLISLLDWDKDLLPLTSNGLKEFSETGQYTLHNGKKYIPKFDEILKKFPISMQYSIASCQFPIKKWYRKERLCSLRDIANSKGNAGAEETFERIELGKFNCTNYK